MHPLFWLIPVKTGGNKKGNKKMKKRILFALASAALLASCGGGSSSSISNTSGGGNSSTSSVSQETKINLTIDKAVIKVGETAKVTSDVAGVEFSSRDESIATVDKDGNVTALKPGTTKIQARKEGYKVGNIDITVEKASARAADFYLEFEDAEHYDPDGFWGMSWGGQVFGPGDTPIEETETAHGGKSIGWFTAGCKETIYFTANKAGKVELDFMMAYNAEMALAGVLTIKVNGVELDVSNKSVAGPEEEGNYYDWNPINFKDVAVVQGENTIVVEALQQGPNMDCVQVYTKEITIEQKKPVEKLDIEGDFAGISIAVGETKQLSVTTEGVAFASSNNDVATVSATGLVTAVAVGNCEIVITKDGYKDAKVSVAVTKAVEPDTIISVLEFENAEHYSPTGSWGSGWSVKDSPIETSDAAHGGQAVGYFATGCKETIEFTSDKAGSADFDIYMGINVDTPLDGVLKMTLNGKEIAMGERVAKGARDGGQWNYSDFQAVSFEGLNILEGKNVLVFEALAQCPNLDYIEATSKEVTLTQLIKLDIEGNFDPVTVETGKTVSLSITTEGVSYASENESVAKIDASGVVTGVAQGSTNIIISKDGYKNAKVAVTVTYKAVAPEGGVVLEFEDATHFSPDGTWGGSWATLTSPVENSPTASGGQSLGNFKTGCTETLTFKASAAGKVDITIVGASSLADYSGYPTIKMAEMPIADYMTMSIADNDVSLADKVLPGKDAQDYYNWQEIVLQGVDVVAGDNSLVVAIIGSQGPNLDYVKIVGQNGVTLSK